MEELSTLTYEVTGPIARITLNRPARGNGITLDMPRELAECVERADLDPNVHVIALAGEGKGFCGGYDLVQSAEGKIEDAGPEGSPIDPMRVAQNHDPSGTWDAVVERMALHWVPWIVEMAVARRSEGMGVVPKSSALQ